MHNPPDQPHLGRLRDVRFAPIFIMGDHRSGTTLLYQLLSDTGCFNVVTAYHIVGYDSILTQYFTGEQAAARQRMAERFVALGIADRQIDGVSATPDLTEEYGFLLGDSYRMQLDRANLGRFMELCRKVQFTAEPERPLLLKNPWDYFCNFMFVKQALPDARFIFIHRDPLLVVTSQIRALRDSLRSFNPYLALLSRWYARLMRRPLQRALVGLAFSPRGDMGVRIAGRHVQRATDYYLRHVGALPAADQIALRYEDLCADPQAAVERVLGFLGLTQRADPPFAAMINQRPPQLFPEVERWRERLRHATAAYGQRYGYSG